MKGVRHRMTYADLEQMPEDGRRYELHDGDVWMVPSPIPLHQLIVGRFADRLKTYRDAFGGLLFMAPLDIVFSEFNTAQPDVVFFVRNREHLIDLRKVIRVPPDIAVEVLSPTTAAVDRGRKMRMFERFGVREYWMVDPDTERIKVHRLDGDRFVLAESASGAASAHSTVLPGFSVDAAALFDVGRAREP